MSLVADLRWAARTMRRDALPTAVVVLSLALAIAVNTAPFSVFHAFLLRALGLADADRLVRVRESFTPGAGHAEVQSVTALRAE